MNRYDRNLGTVTKDEMRSIRKSHVAVIGCGGLGGYVIEMLGRIGIGRLTVSDGDSFEQSNLNRQLLAENSNIGENKALAAKKRMAAINLDVDVQVVINKITLENAIMLLNTCDVLVDAVDAIETRFMLQEIAEKLRIPLVHGAIAGWHGQVTTVFPGDRSLEAIYPDRSAQGIEKHQGCPSFTPAVIAGIQVSEVVKIIIDRGEILRGKMMLVDLLNQDYELLNLAHFLK